MYNECLFSILVQPQRVSAGGRRRSISVSLEPESAVCANQIVYQIYKDSDGLFIRDGVTTDSRFTLSDLECGTIYRLYLRNNKTGLDHWTSVATSYETASKSHSTECQKGNSMSFKRFSHILLLSRVML